MVVLEFLDPELWSYHCANCHLDATACEVSVVVPDQLLSHLFLLAFWCCPLAVTEQAESRSSTS